MRATRTRTCCSRRTCSASSEATPTSTACISPMRSSGSSLAPRRRSPRTARRRTPIADQGGLHGHHDAEHPQAERQQPHDADLRPRRRARLRGGGRLGEEDDPRVPREGPGRPDAAPRGGGSAEGRALGELRDHAVPLQQARPRSLLPDRSGRAGDGGQRDVLPDRHALPARRAGHLPERSASGSTRERSRPPTSPTS